MKSRYLIMALVLAMLVPFAASALDVEWSGSYSATGFTWGEDITEFDSAEGDQRGVYQSVRIAPTFDFGNDVKMHVGLRLYEDYWSGDHRKQEDGGGVTEWGDVTVDIGTGEGSIDERFGLDYGYVELPVAGGKLSVGRQKANWGHGLTTSDDRRDRVAYRYDLSNVLGGPLSLLALWDLRQNVDDTLISDDGHLLSAAAVGYNKKSKIMWGLLGGYFLGDATATNGFVLDNVAIAGPFMEGPVGPIDLKFAAHTLFPIDNDRLTLLDVNKDGDIGGVTADSGGLWNTFNFAAMVRPALDFSEVSSLQPQVLVVEAQGLFVYNGGLVDPGFDTFSSMIGNSGRNTVNPVHAFNMGGLGYEGDHQLLGAARANYEIFPGLNAILGGGVYHFFEYKRDGLDEGAFAAANELMREARTGYFADVRVEYAISQQATLYANYGYLTENTTGMKREFTGTWSDISSGDPRQQLSAGVEVKF